MPARERRTVGSRAVGSWSIRPPVPPAPAQPTLQPTVQPAAEPVLEIVIPAPALPAGAAPGEPVVLA